MRSTPRRSTDWPEAPVYRMRYAVYRILHAPHRIRYAAHRTLYAICTAPPHPTPTPSRARHPDPPRIPRTRGHTVWEVRLSREETYGWAVAPRWSKI
ncbi:hypothetical protein SGPA1_10773 [Streptomyces misionensis JCM 4497]